MKFELYGQLREPNGAAVCEIDHLPPGGSGDEWIGKVVGRIRLTNVGTSIRAQGDLTATARLPCSRCTKPLTVSVHVQIDDDCVFAQIDEPRSYAADPESEDVEAVPILDDDVLDLSELVRQNLVVSLPPAPLCSPECRGLCPHCGQDLNVGECSCHEGRIDPRLAKLKELLERE
ncbi:MAG: DUF177 domain-containing protein [Armatimonadota bacterium]